MLSKEDAWITPVLRRRAQTVAAAAVAAITAALLFDLPPGAGPVSRSLGAGYAELDFTQGQRLLAEPRVILFHLSQIAMPLPSRFSLLHDSELSTSPLSPPETLIALAVIAGWAAAGLLLLRAPRRHLIGFLLLWSFAALAIESSAVALNIAFEHRMYLPSVGLFGLAALALAALPRPAVAAADLAAVELLAIASVAYLGLWSDRLAIYEHTARRAPGSVLAPQNAGNALLDAGQDGQAIEHHRAALSLPSPSANRGITAAERASISYDPSISPARLGRTAEASEALIGAVASHPVHLKALASLAQLAMSARDAAEAEKWLRRLTAADPGNARAWAALGEVTCGQGRIPECAGYPRKALEIDPGLDRARQLLTAVNGG